MIGKLLGALLPNVFGVIDKAILDKDQAHQLKSQIQLALLQSGDKEIEAAARVIIAEAQGGSWLQRNWRPLLMITIVAIVANNFIVYPYVILFGGQATVLDLPPELYNLMAVGVGGYVVGRSGEKIASTWKHESSG